MTERGCGPSLTLAINAIVLLAGLIALVAAARRWSREWRLRRLERVLAKGDVRAGLGLFLERVNELTPSLGHQAPVTATTGGLSRRIEIVAALCRLDPTISSIADESGYLELLRAEYDAALDGSTFSGFGFGYSAEGRARFDRITGRLNEATGEFLGRLHELFERRFRGE